MPAYFISYFSPMLGLLTGLFVLKGMEPQQFAYSARPVASLRLFPTYARPEQNRRDMFRRRPN
jgi:hypothetical protein